MLSDDTFIEEYLVEAREHIDEVENDILILEGKINNPDFNLIDKIFRSIHTIKGGAGFFKINKINKLCHHFETMLNLLRSKKAHLTNQHIETLLSGVDRFKVMLGEIEQSDNVEIQDLIDKCLFFMNDKNSSLNKNNQTKISSDTLLIENLAPQLDTFENMNQYKLIIDCHALYQNYQITPFELIHDFNSMGDILEGLFENTEKNIYESNEESEPLLLSIHYNTLLHIDIVSLIFHIPKESIDIIQAKSKRIKNFTKQISCIEEDNKLKDITIQSQVQIQKAKKTNQKQIKQSSVLQKEKQTSIRIGLNVLDKLMNYVGELVLVRNKFLMEVTKADAKFYEIFQEMDIVTSDIQDSAMMMRMQPIDRIFSKVPRMVRDLSKLFNKNIQLVISGNNVELDQNIIESMSDPIMHIIRNCCDHGIESSTERLEFGKTKEGLIQLNAFHRGGRINIEISDNGRGINIHKVKEKILSLNIKSEQELNQMSNNELLPMIMSPGLTTAKHTTEISGRGVGMDVVKTSIEKIGGTIDINSELHKGTTFMLSLPLTLTIFPCLIVVSGDEKYAIPQSNLVELVRLYENEIFTEIKQHDDQEVYLLRDKILPIIRLNEILKRRQIFKTSTKLRISKKYKKLTKINFKKKNLKEKILTFAVVKYGIKMFGIIIDDIKGTKELVVNPLLQTLSPLKIYSGTTILGNGEVALVLDIENISKHARIDFNKAKSSLSLTDNAMISSNVQKALIFQIGEKEQFAVPLIMVKRVIPIKKEQIGTIGKNKEKEYINIQKETFHIVRLDKFIDISACINDSNLFILIPKNSKIKFGLLFSELKGVVDMPPSLDEETYKIEAIFGSYVLNNNLTLFLNIDAITIKIENLYLKLTPLLPQKTLSDSKVILLVEDTPFFRKLTKGFLKKEGFIVHTASNGIEALKILESKQFDLIISDIEMPEMNGWEFMEKVKSINQFKNIPSIALTSLDSDKDRNKSKAVGFDIHEIKINQESLMGCVKKLIE